jgi:hypothetical protein
MACNVKATMDDGNPYQSPSPIENSPPAIRAASSVGEIPFAGGLTVADIYEADRLLVPRWRKWLGWGVIGVIGLASVPSLAAAADAYWRNEFEAARMWGTAALILIIITFIPGGQWLLRWYRNVRWCRRQLGLYRVTQGSANERGFESRVEFAVSFMEWEAFRGFRDSDNVAIVFQKPPNGGWVMFARSKFASDSDWRRFRDLVSRKLPRA